MWWHPCHALKRIFSWQKLKETNHNLPRKVSQLKHWSDCMRSLSTVGHEPNCQPASPVVSQVRGLISTGFPLVEPRALNTHCNTPICWSTAEITTPQLDVDMFEVFGLHVMSVCASAYGQHAFACSAPSKAWVKNRKMRTPAL